MTNKIALRPGVHIGEPAAEDDSAFLSACFVDLPILRQLKDMDSSKCIILGRTGSGKTAILKHIEAEKISVIRIDPMDIAFDYIGNSNILRFLVELGCDLSVLFQLLWKHILCTKAMKCYFENQGSFESALERVFDRKNAARVYFEKYADRFWVEHDEALREISRGFESKVGEDIKATIGVDFAKVEAGLADSLSLTGNQRREIVSRIKKAVSELQIRELARAIDALNELMENKYKNYYVLVDDLDLDWAEDDIKYSLIRALVDSAKGFRKLRNVKVLIALRSDLYDRAMLAEESGSMQPEKYEGLICEIKWNASQLREVVDKRIDHLFKHVYMKKGVKFYDIFPQSIRKQPSIEYIVDRTLYRPRDVIAFINVVLDRSAGAVSIPPKNITDSEAEYSKKRLDALCREWFILHPNLKTYLSFLKGKTGRNEFSDVATREVVFDVCLSIDEFSNSARHKDGVARQCEIYSKRENLSKIRDVAAALLSVLYKVGAVELKLSKGDIYRACYKNEAVILADQIGLDAAFAVSPMLWRSLGITPNLG